MLWVGIDPGKQGAIAALDENGRVVFIADMPLDEEGELDYLNMGDVFAGLLNFDESLDVTMEKVRPMPHFSAGKKIGHSSIGGFKLGENYGAWRREIGAYKIKPHLVDPSSWKRIMLAGLPPGKESSVKMAERMWRHNEASFRTPRGRLLDGRAEACLLAELGRRTWRLSHGIGA